MTLEIRKKRTGAKKADGESRKAAGEGEDRSPPRALKVLPNWMEEDLVAQIGPSVDANNDGDEGTALSSTHPSDEKTLQDLLTLSRVGGLEPVQTLNVDEVLDEVLRKQSIPDEFTIKRDFECTEIKTSAGDLFTLLSVLICNAVTHHDRTKGEICVSTRLNEGFVSLSVKDDGPGIPARYLERVFEMMSTLKTNDERKGNGMGLAIGRQIMSHYRGNLRASSDESLRGVEVIATFPTN